ncbi:MAG: glycosyltransferase family 39 protein, partial [Anaerolineae bacterium]
MTMSRRHLVALIALIALALGLRLYRLDSQSLWNDEGTSVALAQRDLATILRNAADDIHPPFYYVTLHAWVERFGITEFAVRGLSVLTGVLVVAGTYFLGWRLLSSRSALLAALFAALSPFQVYYSQETRMYIGGTLVALALVAACHELLVRWDSDLRLASWPAVAVAVAGTAVLYTHYYGATVLLAVNIAFFIWCILKRKSGAFPWDALWRWGIIMLVTGAAFVPWLLTAWSTIIHWPAVSAPTTLTQLARDLMVVLPLGITAPEGGFALVVGIVSAALATAGFV